MLENRDEYLKEIRAYYETIPEDRLIDCWHSDIIGLLAPFLQMMGFLKSSNPADFAEILDQEMINGLLVKGEKAMAEIDYIVQFVERLQQQKSDQISE